ncbi:hypothetical protein [Pedobacter xixiisoli]|uniref:Adhesin domain-containing protein n=1 Tax=Pedobacter xixiisoli TaxID=1476464 RepID=A0A286AEJ7_9SPHI|nr:hypothetical protein [Pedobacter xixiisoli]SOD20307.1 hypothetical protein SAMN06297358_4022 [Pedobacter xixiisoli]
MNKITFIASALLLTAVQAFAQKEFKVAKSGGKLVITNISNLSVEGYDGKDIIFSATSKEENKNDPRAAGLSALSNVGFDNTGIGLSVTEKESITLVSSIEKDLTLKVKLPKNVALSFKTTGFANGDSTVITLSNIQSEVDASTQYENVSLKNVTGPISLKTLYGNIEGKLMPSFKGPISLVSVYGFIDVTVPENTKADMSINTTYETLYAAKDLKLVVDDNQPKDISSLLAAVDTKSALVITTDGSSPAKVKGTGFTTTSTEASATAPSTTTLTGKNSQLKNKTNTVTSDYSYTYTTNAPLYFGSSKGTVVNGKLNGGGEKIILKSTYGKIYLRK